MYSYAEGGSAGTNIRLLDRQAYTDYKIDQESQGNEALPFEQWVAARYAPGEDAGTGTPPPQQAGGAPGSGILDRLRSFFHFAGGGGVNPELLDPSYYESDMIPPHTAAMAAGNAGNRMMGGTEDGRAMQMRMRMLIDRLRRQRGAGGEAMAPMGSRGELMQRLRGMNSAGAPPRMASGGPVHVNPNDNGGFLHRFEDMYSYAPGGPVVGGPTMPAGMPTGAPGTMPSAQPIGALAQLGQQLVQQQQGVAQSFNIPGAGGPPAVGAPRQPEGMVGNPLTAMTQNPIQFARGGRVSANVAKMALRNPRMRAKYCGGGRAY